MIWNSWNVGKIPRMRKQCVPGLLFRGRPGNEARVRPSVALSSSIIPGVAKSDVLFTRALLQNCVDTCTYRMHNFIIHMRLQVRTVWAARVVAPLKGQVTLTDR